MKIGLITGVNAGSKRLEEVIIDMSNITIRKADESDISGIEKLSLGLIKAMEYNDGFDAERLLYNCHHFLTNDNYYILVAEMDEKLIGFISFTTYRTILHPEPSGLACELFVIESHRAKGVGTLLVESFIEMCRKLGCCEVELSTEINNKRAMRFYNKLGFEEIGIIFEKDL